VRRFSEKRRGLREGATRDANRYNKNYEAAAKRLKVTKG